ncbi:DUF6087 family protein [Streptomyces cucumeris]
MDEEPLEEWASRRERGRPSTGERRSVPLGDEPEGAAHLSPDAPRGIQEWDGHQWAPAGVAGDLAAAASAVGDDDAERARRVPLPPSSALPPLTEPWRPTEAWHRP